MLAERRRYVGVRGRVRFCPCGTRLASDNPGVRCGACQRGRARGPGSAPVVPPDFWVTDRMSAALASRHIGTVICSFRTDPWHDAPISQAVVAEWAAVSQTSVSRIEAGPPILDLGRLVHWARVLRIPARLLWFELDIPGTPGGSPDAGRPGQSAAQPDEVSSSRRRDFVASGGLAAVGGLAVAGGIAGDAGFEALERELDLIHITLDRGTTSEQRTVWLEQVASDLGVQAGEVAPAALVKPALGALRSIRMLLEQRQPTGQQVRLARASAMVSQVVGETMFGTGQTQRARAWYQATEKAAADAGDRYLLDIALSGQAMLLTYADDPRGALRLVEPRLDGAPSPSPAVARLWGFKARAHAALGDVAEFQRSIESARQALDNSRHELICPGILSCTTTMLDFYETTSAVQLNRPAVAIRAADHALLSGRPTTTWTGTRLVRASALAQSGEVDEACREATATLLDPGTLHRMPIRANARKFDEVIRGINSAATREWHQVHADKHGRKRSSA